MMFMKTMCMKLSMSIIMVSVILAVNLNSSLEVKMMNSSSNFLTLSLSLEKSSLTFGAMVSIVTWAVLSYSTMYMESYNKKKFFMIMMLFFLSMMMLSYSNSILATITGWDGLGISSIALIMMYQNNTTMSNSLLTMFFNRIGDVTMFLSISEMIKDLNEEFSPEMTNKKNLPLWVYLTITAMTKSAQLPLSAWLPAAMSAPTPISAMVHSSTLVTAGLYLVMKMMQSMKMILPTIMIISMLTLLMASISANMETDLKKIVAYSTMSQISIIMLMCSLIDKKMAMMQMFNHAIFKTLTFMSVGKLFMENWSNQDNRKMSNNKSSSLVKNSLNSSMMAMAGTPFSSSFFSKDKFLEMTKWMSKTNSTMCVLMMSSMATIFYCKKIMISMKTPIKNNKSLKKMSAISFMFMSLASSVIGSMNLWMMKFMKKPIISKMEVMFITTVVMLSCMKNMKIKKNSYFNILNTNMFMKWWSTNYIYNMSKNSKMVEMLDSTMLMMSPWKNNKLSSNLNKISMATPTIVMLMTMQYYTMK